VAGLLINTIPGVKNLPRFVKETLVLGAGVAGNKLFSEFFEDGLEVDWFRNIATSPELNTIANMAGTVGGGVEAYFWRGIAIKLGTMLGNEVLITAAEILAPIYAFWKTLTFGMSDSAKACKRVAFTRSLSGTDSTASLSSFAQDGAYYIGPGGACGLNFPTHGIEWEQTISARDPVMFQMAIFLWHQGYLKTYPSMGKDLLDQIDLNDNSPVNAEKTGEIFGQYVELLESNEELYQGFLNDFAQARYDFSMATREAGYVWPYNSAFDSRHRSHCPAGACTPQPLQKGGLFKEFVGFTTAQEQARYKAVVEPQKKSAQKAAEKSDQARRTIMRQAAETDNTDNLYDQFVNGVMEQEIPRVFGNPDALQVKTILDLTLEETLSPKEAAEKIAKTIPNAPDALQIELWINGLRAGQSLIETLETSPKENFTEQLEEAGYLKYLKKHDIYRDEYIYGNQFKATFEKFLIYKDKTDLYKDVVRLCKLPEAKWDKPAKMVQKAYGEYKKDHPKATPQEFAKYFTNSLLKDHSQEIAENLQKMVWDEESGTAQPEKFRFWQIPDQELRKDFYAYLTEKYPEMAANNWTENFTPDDAAVLLTGQLSKRKSWNTPSD